MVGSIALRKDYDGAMLRRLAKGSRDAGQTRRLLSLAVIYDGRRRGAAAELGGVTLQVIRDWVLRFNACGPNGLIDRKAPGGRHKLNDDQRRGLKALVESGPIPSIHGVVRWRLVDLVQWVWEEFGLRVKRDTVSRELKAMGFARITARPQHRAQNELTLEAFKKASPPSWQRSGPGSRATAR